MNYVFLLESNSYVSGLNQVVINESNLAVVFVLSSCFLGNRYHKGQWALFVVVAVGGLMPLAQAPVASTQNQPIWLALYMLGAWAIGIANIITENVMRNMYYKKLGDDDKQYLVGASQFLCLTNVYSIFVVICLAGVPRTAQGPSWWRFFINGMLCLWTGRCHDEDSTTCPNQGNGLGIVAMWSAATLSFVCAYIAARIQRRHDAVFVTVAYALGPVVSMVLFMLKCVMGTYFSTPSSIEIWSNVVTLSGGILYKVFTLKYGELTPQQSACTSRFKIEPFRETDMSLPRVV